MADGYAYNEEEFDDVPEKDADSDFLEPGHKIGWDRLLAFADSNGDISTELTENELTKLGEDVVSDWERDRASLSEWVEGVEAALAIACQDKPNPKTYPFENASNVQYPILTVAAQQFAARAYPAIIKGDEAVGVKVLGDKPQAPEPPPQNADPAIQAEAQRQAQEYVQAMRARMSKEARAKRVKTYLNYRLFYGMPNWEADVDVLLNQIPISGMAFKKVYRDPLLGTISEFVNALRLTVPMDTQSLERCPRVTQDFDIYPYEIRAKQRSGVYRDFELDCGDNEDREKSRVALEQHRLEDLDGDGVEEPYIVTVDKDSRQVLRIEAAFTRGDITAMDDPQAEDARGTVISIKRWMPFVEYPFLPDPRGRFYALGFGQMLKPLNEVINTSINELLDAGHAQVAGGGFIASGVRLQGAGQTSTLRWRPGEYKFVNTPAAELKNAIVERTVPQPSTVLFQLLDLVLGAAKDIASVKDVLTGDSPATAPVGTTLALIEQGLQSFTAIYKRIYRSLKAEYQKIYECEARWGGQMSAREYVEVLDDPAADFEADFSPKGNDIVPVSDPSVVTKAQALAKAQVIQQFLPLPITNQKAALTRIYEAADIDNPEELFNAQNGPPPEVVAAAEAKIAVDHSTAEKNQATALKAVAEAGQIVGQTQAEQQMGAMNGADQGRMGDLEGQPGQSMGVQGPPDVGGGPAPGVDLQQLGANAGGADPGAGPQPPDQAVGPENPS